jgi:hypothetical protein
MQHKKWFIDNMICCAKPHTDIEAALSFFPIIVGSPISCPAKDVDITILLLP